MKNLIILTLIFLFSSFEYVYSCKIIPETKVDPGIAQQLINYSIMSNNENCCQSCLENTFCTYFHFLHAAIPLCIQYQTNMTLNELIENSSTMFNYDFGVVSRD